MCSKIVFVKSHWRTCGGRESVMCARVSVQHLTALIPTTALVSADYLCCFPLKKTYTRVLLFAAFLQNANKYKAVPIRAENRVLCFKRKIFSGCLCRNPDPRKCIIISIIITRSLSITPILDLFILSRSLITCQQIELYLFAWYKWQSSKYEKKKRKVVVHKF